MWFIKRGGGKQCADHESLQRWDSFSGDRQWPVVLVLRRQQRRNDRKLFGPLFACADKWPMRPRQWRGGEHRADHWTLLSRLGLISHWNRAMELVLQWQ